MTVYIKGQPPAQQKRNDITLVNIYKKLDTLNLIARVDEIVR